MHPVIKGNPRAFFAFHKERGPVKHCYTNDDISRLTGLSVKTLLNYQTAGKVDLDNLESVLAFVAARRGCP